MNRLILLGLLLVSSLYVYPQSRSTVSGVVKDEQGVTLPGISLLLKGTTTGTSTDANGAFRINVTGANPTLVVSGVGYLRQEVAAGNAATLTIVLREDPKTLNEVIVTGFGVKQETRKLAYAAQEVKGQDLERANSANLVNALQGKVAGVQIDQGSGGPMSSSRIRIRGNASLSPNTQPLFVVDGVLIRPATTGADSWGAAQDFGNIMKNLNADNVETMTVLKGSAASALYGSEALNGVVVITTKRGREQKGLGVSYTHTSSFENAYRFLDVQNQYGAGISQTFAKAADGTDLVDTQNWNYSFGPKLDGHMVRDIDGRMIPWQANTPLNFFQTGRYTNHNVAVEGGNDRSSFRASFSNLFNNTIMPGGAEMKRNNFNVRATQKLGKIVNLDVSADYTDNNNLNPIRQGGNFNPVFRFVYNRPRTLDIDYWTANYASQLGGRKRNADDPYNITEFLWQTFQYNTTRKEKVFRGNIDVNLNITPWLTGLVRANLQNELYQTENKNLGDGVGFAGGEYSQYSQANNQSRFQGLLTFNRDLSSLFHLNLTVGGETNRINGGREFRLRTDGGLRIPGQFALPNSINSVVADISGERLASSKRTDAVYAYGDISYKDALFLNFTNRIDYSSALTYANGSGQYSYYYPSVGLAWDFTQSVKGLPGALTFGKLRASYGFTGGDTDAWRTNQTGFYSAGSVFTSVNGQLQQYGFRDNTLPNYNLRNRLAREWEVGADMRFFNNRLGLDVAVYNKLTRNEIFSLPVAQESGIGSRLVNAGKILNRGVEVLLTGTPIKTSKFQWNTSFNFSRNRNRILELADGIDTYQLSLAFGADIQSIARAGGDYGTINTSYAFARDDQGRKLIGAASGTTGGYLTYLRSGAAGQGSKDVGTMLEKFLLSNVNNFRYGNFSATFQVDSKIGGVMASATHAYGSANGSLTNSLFGRDTESGGITFTDAEGNTRNDGIIPEGILNAGVTATVDGQQIDLGGMTYKEAVDKGYLKPIPAYAYYDNLSNWGSGIREYSVFENSWVAVREASISYDVPASLLNKIKVQSLRLSVVGRNLGYLYRTAPGGINPQSLKSNNAGEFAEYGGLPFSRNIGVTVNVGL
ncbi:SusC/RagA family TonB-linked outer membrane protein [Spirosoma utsteinense]|uniref:Iron complex outermembrane receptor protein n=1 Tax=Spirosoma utsteinense TaxID=2585773 RepID=A0ABR6WBL6_9BACT|nr:SusC/RagA family TonB-linked outer membrane protein [Spirosoma utsteinense]MBC3788081.1 iron complex outermembrane receptor protein [Spirosoma utsteinense]MBC3793966.1 iron complex outermembrane receptor protein [Spirosoma utsteinense]